MSMASLSDSMTSSLSATYIKMEPVPKPYYEVL
jgi:hypothetical protein